MKQLLLACIVGFSLLATPVNANASDSDGSWFRSAMEFFAGLFNRDGGDNDGGDPATADAGSTAPDTTTAPTTVPATTPATPVLGDNDASAEFLAGQIAAETGWEKDKMIPYSRRLAKTLSQLSAREQTRVFYGR